MRRAGKPALLDVFSGRDWEALARSRADDATVEDCRPVVNYGLMQGPGFQSSESLRVGGPDTASRMYHQTTIATRGESALPSFISTTEESRSAVSKRSKVTSSLPSSNRYHGAEWGERGVRRRGLRRRHRRTRLPVIAGEGSRPAQTWSAVASAYTAINRLQMPLMTPDCVTVDHRGELAFGPDELSAYLRAGRDGDRPRRRTSRAVHRLGDRHRSRRHIRAANETLRGGFDAEWRASLS